jgi:hypothetical protein
VVIPAFGVRALAAAQRLERGGFDVDLSDQSDPGVSR